MLKIWLSAARPKTLPAALSPVLMGLAMAWKTGAFDLLTAAATLAGALLIQIGTNFANDYYDFKKGADRGDRTGPARATQSGLVTPQAMKRAFVITFTMAVATGLFLVYKGGWPILTIGILSVISGILYTGGPFPLGYLGLGDLFVLVFFGPVAVGGTYYLQTAGVTAEVLLAGLAPGFIAAAILAVNNLRDAPTDRLAGKKTLAVRWGAAFARWEYLLCLVAANIIAAALFSLRGKPQLGWALALTLGLSVSPLQAVFSPPDGPALNKALASTGRYLLLFSLLFSAMWNAG